MEEQPIDYQESGEERSQRHVTIDTLSDDALLEIFSSLQKISQPYDSWLSHAMGWWIPLVHTCQRWRHIILASPLRLRLVLSCRPSSAARKWKSLDIWPPFPISVSCHSTNSGDHGSLVATLEHRDRVYKIDLGFQEGFEVETVAAVVGKPFPALKSLSLRSDDVERYIPEAFLGGSAPSLRTLILSLLIFPALPKLLLSAPNLVSLTLERTPIRCDAMATCLAALVNLERLCMEGFATRSHYNHTSPPSLPRAVVPALTYFSFRGFDEHLDDLLARIDAPVLRTVIITFEFEFEEAASTFHIPQLHRFISSAERFDLANRASLWFAYATGCGPVFLILKSSLPGSERALLLITCLQDSQIKLVCHDLYPLLSRVDCLDLYVSAFMPVQESIPWLDIFRPFIAVQSLRVTEERWRAIAPVLRDLTGERVMEVLPNLRTLVFGEFQPCPSITAAFEPFIAARQLSGHPVATHINHWEEDAWECMVQSLH